MTNKIDAIVNDETPKIEKRKAFIAFVLDESGSMATGREATISGMNEQIQQIKSTFKDSKDVEPIVTFVKFNGIVTPLYVNKTLEDLKEFTPADYQPNGSTAMYDGVGYVLNTLENSEGISDEDTSVLVVVISDGEENQSREHNSSTIADRVNKFNETKRWTFTYLGSNVDLTKVQQSTGFRMGNTISFDSSSNATYAKGFASHAQGFSNYLSDMNVSSSVLRASKMSLSSDSFYTSTTGTVNSSTSQANGESTSESENKTESKV